MTDNTTDLSQMSIHELVNFYNRLTETEEAKALDYKPVNRFADRESGIKRIQRLQSSIKARKEGLAAEARNHKEGEPVSKSPTTTKNPPKPAALQKGSPAKAAPAKSTAKPAAKAASPAKAKPAAKSEGYVDPIFGKLRADSNRAKLSKMLRDNLGKPVAISKLINGIYGDTTDDGYGPLTMVIKGLNQIIDANKLKEKSGVATTTKGYEIRKEKVGNEIAYGLYKGK